MNAPRLALPGVLFALLALAACPPLPPAPEVATDAGPVIGVSLGFRADVDAYKGIPYAAPPVGDQRWRPPAPAVPWEEPLDAAAFRAQCPQPSSTLGGREGEVRGVERCEDCLYLNVWRPSDAAPGADLPVMVWIHGGGFQTSSGGSPFYDGENLARRGVIVVTFNYRLGKLGFLAHPALSGEDPDNLSGNYGLLDQIAALEWVQRNIAQFGGDPGNVTIFGESAGGMSVGFLLVSPLTEGLFHRAVLQSGIPWPAPILDRATPMRPSAEDEGLEIAASLGITGTGAAAAAALRAVPAEDLIGIAEELEPWELRVPYGPVVDGIVVPDQPMLLMQAGAFHRVPIMAGSNADEATLFLIGSEEYRVWRASQYLAFVNGFFGPDAAAVLALYPAPRAFAFDQMNRLSSDFGMLTPTRMLVEAADAHGVPAFKYYFTRRPRNIGGDLLGSHHAAEIPFVFGNLFARSNISPNDRALSDLMQQYWIQFAATGNPNMRGMPFWPAYDTATDPHLELGDVVRAGAQLLKAEADLFIGILQAMYENAGVDAALPATRTGWRR